MRWLIHRREADGYGKLKVVHVNVNDDRQTSQAWFIGVGRGPVMTVSLRWVDGRWRGVKHGSDAMA